MTTTFKHPATVETVGNQFICFDTMETDGSWTSTFDTAVSEYPTVTEIEVADNNDSYEPYASGKIYESDAPVTSKTITVTNIAFDSITIEKMKGSDIDGGAVLSGGTKNTRPYFAYGVDVINKDKTHEFRWYPKCKLIDNDDKTSTSADKHSDQTKQLTITAYGFDDDGHIDCKVFTSEKGYENVKAADFFTKPILTLADAKKLGTAAGV